MLPLNLAHLVATVEMLICDATRLELRVPAGYVSSTLQGRASQQFTSTGWGTFI